MDNDPFFKIMILSNTYANAERGHGGEGQGVGEEEGERRAYADELDAHAEGDDALVQGDGDEQRPHILRVLLQSDGEALQRREERKVGKSRQTSLARAGTIFTQPGTIHFSILSITPSRIYLCIEDFGKIVLE